MLEGQGLLWQERWQQMCDYLRKMPLSYKGAMIIYTIFFAGLFSQFLLFGDFVAPYLPSIELRAPAIELENGYSENRKFSDYSNSYIPEISEALSGVRSGWLTLWNQRNELGRPLYQLSGFTSAYLPSWVMAQFIDNPWKFITILSIFTCFISGLFLIFFFKELNLAPLAALVGGVSLAASPFFMYWLTFPMFPATWCWAAGALCGLTRIAKKTDLLGWIILAFSIYSLGMTAYPQPVVYNGYIILGYGIYLARGRLESGWSSLREFIFFSSSAAFIGMVFVLPVYIDLAYIAANSSRVSPPPSFFSMYLPHIDNWDDLILFISLLTLPEIFGNPISSNFPFEYNGLSTTVIVLLFTLIGLFGAFQKTWGWWIAVVMFLAMTFSRDLYEFGAQYFGFNLSPSIPLGGIMLPLIVIATIGVDELISCESAKHRCILIVSSIFIICFFIAISIAWGTSKGHELRWHVLVIALVSFGLLMAQIDKTRPWLLILVLAIITAAFSYPLMIRQSAESIAKTSPLVMAVKKELAESGGRFAIVGSDLRVLPPNLNATLGLDSIHSYNSLSSLRYQSLINELGGDPKFLGRWNASIAPDYNSSVFWMSNITLILAPQRLNELNLDFLFEVSGVYLHKVKSSIGDVVQILSSSVQGNHGAFSISDPRGKAISYPVKKNDQGDLFELDLVPVNSSSVLILSQKFHRDWQAKVLTKIGWEAAETSVVNGVFQGVSLPPESRFIRMEFKPYARYAWLGHFFWLGMFVFMAFRIWTSRHRVQAS